MKHIVKVLVIVISIFGNLFAIENSSWNFLNFSQDSKIPKFGIPSLDNLIFKKYSVSSSYQEDAIVSNIVSDGVNLYFLDSKSNLIIFNLLELKIINKIKLPNYTKKPIVGIALFEDYIYISFENGNIIAFSLISNSISWESNVIVPITSAPVVSNNKVIIVAYNKVIALDKDSGKETWSALGSKIGISAKKLNSPTIYDGYVWVGLFSSDILVIKEENGNILWRNNLLGSNLIGISPNPLIGDIKASILVDKNRALVVSNNKMSLYSSSDGKVLWSNSNVASYNTPIIINNLAYIVDVNGNAVQINLKNGSILWKKQLDTSKKIKEKVYWNHPLIVNNLILLSSIFGDILFLSPKNGSIVHQGQVYKGKGEKIYNAPIIIQNKIIFLSSDGNLYISQN